MGLSGFGITEGNYILNLDIINFSKIQSTAIYNDSIFNVDHTIQFCRPIPSIAFDINSIPPMDTCDVFTRDLNAYPLNQPTIYQGNLRTFGTSEMVLTFIRFENYPRSGGFVKLNFLRPDGSSMYSTTSNFPVPNPEWTTWYGWAWGCVGKFDDTTGYSTNEIIIPGNYIVKITSSWGNADISYVVTGASITVADINFTSNSGCDTLCKANVNDIIRISLKGIASTTLICQVNLHYTKPDGNLAILTYSNVQWSSGSSIICFENDLVRYVAGTYSNLHATFDSITPI